MTSEQNTTITPERLAILLAELPDVAPGIMGRMPDISIANEMAMIRTLEVSLENLSVRVVHVRAESLPDDREDAITTIADILPARDDSDGRTVIIVSGLTAAGSRIMRLLDAVIMGDIAQGELARANARFLVLSSSYRHQPAMLRRLVTVDIALPAESADQNRLRR